MSTPLNLRLPRLYFSNPVGRLLEHPEGYVVVEYASGKRRFEELQGFLNHAADLLRLRGWNKLLGDQRNMMAFTEEERAWITDNWLQAATKGTTIYGAILIAHDVFARLSMNLVMSETHESALAYRLFENETDAHLWLRQL